MNVQRRSLATSTTDLCRLQPISTSTSNLTLTKDSETETENGEIDYRDGDAFSQTDSESGGSEGENSSEENAVSVETTRDQEHTAQTTADRGSCIQAAANTAQNSAPGATARPDAATFNFNEPLNMVQIVQHQEITRNTYLAGSIKIDWTPFLQERQAQLIQTTERKMKKQLKAHERNIIREIQKQFTSKTSEERREHKQNYKQLQESMNKIMDKQSEIYMALQEKEKRQEKEAKIFAFSLSEKHKRVLERAWSNLNPEQLLELVKRLYEKFKIRLREVGVYCGLRFVVDVPVEQAEALGNQQAAIQETILNEVLPEDFRQEVEWEPPVEVEVVQELPLPIQASDTQEGVSTSAGSDQHEGPDTATRPQLKFDPMAAIPRRSFTVETSSGGEEASRITSLVITSSGLLVMADYTNMSVKLTPMDQSAQPLILCLNARPWDLAIYKDDVIAVTSGTDIIVLLSISTDNISIDRQVETKQRYWCVASDGQGDTLVVSTVMDHHGPAVVDVITIEGKVLWTLGTEVSDPKIRRPVSLCVLGRDVFVSDKEEVVHRLDVVKGTRSDTLTHSDLKWPGQVAVDAAGNIYIASNHQEGCVLVYSASGQWRKLLDGQEHGENERTRPQAVGITENGIIVSWERDMSQSVVIGFDL